MTERILNYAPRRSWARPRGDTLALLVVLGVSLLLFLARGWGGIMIAHLWRTYAAGMPINRTENELSGILVDAGQWAIPSTLVVFLVLAFWMHRAHRRLRALTEEALRFSHIEAVLGWVLPGGFVIRPFEVMKEIYTKSRGVPAWSFTPLCGFWWGSWLAAMFLNFATYLAISTSHERGADLYISHGICNAVGAVPVMVAGACLTGIVWRVDRAQARRRPSIASLKSL